MDDDYMIVPVPKCDEIQEYYNTRLDDNLQIVVIPITCVDIDIVGAALEIMASEVYQRVAPVCYEQALKVKYSCDQQSGQMIDLNGYFRLILGKTDEVSLMNA